jgi:hypothetical protein
VREQVTIWYRGARYELGRRAGGEPGGHCYAIWAAGAPRSQPLESWPETAVGWSAAWARYISIETPGTVRQVSQPADADARALTAFLLLAAGVCAGIVGLFPDYLGGTSLASQPYQLVPHLIYLAAWTAGAVLILAGGDRARAGVLLAAGTTVVTLGLFVADIGTALAGSPSGAGLVLGSAGWLGCAAGAVLAFPARDAVTLLRARRPPRGAVLLALAGLGTAVAFAPSWDSYTLRTASGTVQTITAGNAFANPGLVIAGDVAVMVAVVVAAVAAALWRPARHGAALLAGAAIPMAAQAVSALIQAGQATSPALFGISPGQAARAGLTISNGLTPVFWVYLAFVVILAGACAVLAAPRRWPGPRNPRVAASESLSPAGPAG